MCKIIYIHAYFLCILVIYKNLRNSWIAVVEQDVIVKTGERSLQQSALEHLLYNPNFHSSLNEYIHYYLFS